MMKETFDTLKPATRRWVNQVKKAWHLEEHHERLLILAGSSWDRAVTAKAIIDADGPVVLDGTDRTTTHWH